MTSRSGGLSGGDNLPNLWTNSGVGLKQNHPPIDNIDNGVSILLFHLNTITNTITITIVIIFVMIVISINVIINACKVSDFFNGFFVTLMNVSLR